MAYTNYDDPYGQRRDRPPAAQQSDFRAWLTRTLRSLRDRLATLGSPKMDFRPVATSTVSYRRPAADQFAGRSGRPVQPPAWVPRQMPSGFGQAPPQVSVRPFEQREPGPGEVRVSVGPAVNLPGVHPGRGEGLVLSGSRGAVDAAEAQLRGGGPTQTIVGTPDQVIKTMADRGLLDPGQNLTVSYYGDPAAQGALQQTLRSRASAQSQPPLDAATPGDHALTSARSAAGASGPGRTLRPDGPKIS